MKPKFLGAIGVTFWLSAHVGALEPAAFTQPQLGVNGWWLGDGRAPVVAWQRAATPGVIGWWSGDGTARDIIGGNNGTLHSGATFATGMLRQAFSLDGTNDYVSIPHAAVLNPNGPFSVHVWIKANPVQSSLDGQFLIVDKSHGWAPPATGWLLQGNSNGTVAFGFGDGGNNAGPPGYPTVSTLASVLDNAWHHLAGVFTGTQLQIYLDGKLQSSRALSISPAGNTREMEIGRSWGGPYGTTRFLHGLIDEVMFYNRALTAGDVVEIFNAGIVGQRQPPGIVKQPTGRAAVLKTAVASSVTSTATTLNNSTPGVSIALYAGVKVEGVTGQTYGIQYAADLSGTDGWHGAANITLVEPTQMWFDPEPANQPKRYYRVVPGPIPIP